MTSYELRAYFVFKYKKRFSKQYRSKYKWKEISVLSKLLSQYSNYLLLEAIDRFISEIDENRAAICYFASEKVFENKFEDLIKKRELVQYQRTLGLYSEEDQKVIKRLLWEYDTYLGSISLNSEDIQRKKEIIKELERLKIAERI